MKRRKFLQQTGLLGLGLAAIPPVTSFTNFSKGRKETSHDPIAICTWNFPNASEKAGEMLQHGASALDAVEQGVMVEEANIKNTTVGKGGSPDREGNVTLDASIMCPKGNAGSVVYLKNYTHAVSVARKVMEETPHVMLAGEGASQFAREQGFAQEELLTPDSETAYKKWLKEKKYKPVINIENHDTIGMLCIDQDRNIAGACTTSGLAYKMNGRVGDSPIIGSGLFLDNEVGGAVATGMGEAIMKNVSSFLVVELMRQGISPQQACEIAIKRIITNSGDFSDFQAAIIALNKNGEIGSYCIHKGFTYMKHHKGINQNFKSEFFI